MLLTIYCSLLRSLIEYACFFFKRQFPPSSKNQGPVCSDPEQSNPFLTGISTRTRISLINQVCRSSPLSLRFKYLSTKFIIKSFFFCDSLVVESFKNLMITRELDPKRTSYPTISLFDAPRSLFDFKNHIFSSYFVSEFFHPYPASFLSSFLISTNNDFLEATQRLSLTPQCSLFSETYNEYQ